MYRKLIWKIDELIVRILDWIDNKYIDECLEHFYSKELNRSLWRGIELPMVRTTFPESFATTITKTQPLDTPSGLLFELDYTTEPYVLKDGDWGHSFIDGHFIYDNGELIFLDEVGFDKFNELHKKYNTGKYYTNSVSK